MAMVPIRTAVQWHQALPPMSIGWNPAAASTSFQVASGLFLALTPISPQYATRPAPEASSKPFVGEILDGPKPVMTSCSVYVNPTVRKHQAREQAAQSHG